MSKLVSLLVAGSGATVASVGGVYILKQGVGAGNSLENKPAGELQEQKTSSPATLNADLTFQDLTTFENGKGGRCVKHVFGDLEFTPKAGEVDKDSNITGIDFSSKTSEEVKSCLVVNWEKTSYSDVSSTGKWKGYFRGVWSFSAGDKGFIIFATTKENSLNLDGGFYYLEQEQDQGKKGSIKKHKKVDGSKAITKDNFASTFPAAGATISNSISDPNKSNWGFVEGQNDIENFCANGDSCGSGTGTTKPFKESWLGTKGGSNAEKITSWMSNYDVGFKEIFKGDTLNLDTFTGFWNKSTPPSS